MRLRVSLPIALVFTPLLVAARAYAEEPSVPENLPRLIHDTGRTAEEPPEDDLLRLTAHGEYQARVQAMRSFLLTPTITRRIAQPTIVGDSIGQNAFLSHWLRVSPKLQIRKSIEIVTQLDLVTGLVLGDLAHDTSADETPRDSYNGFSNIQPRWAYVQFNTEIGVLRVGQQPNHWGLGILANDGDHPTLFGDYRYGAISERLLFATKPGGRNSPFTVAIAGDLVYRDRYATLTEGDHAYQGVLAAYYGEGQNMFGFFGTVRRQERDRMSSGSTYSEYIDAGAMDLFGRFAAPIPGQRAYVFGAIEAALILGSTNVVRPSNGADSSTIQSYGGAAQVGVVHEKYVAETKSAQAHTFGDWVVQLEAGYASGDADPNDGKEHRFVFDPNHRVGLLLFDELMRWQTARAASAALDPNLTNSERPPPGSSLLPSNGGVFGAQYINPTAIVRPSRNLDLKAGAVLAQTTADLVDPYRVKTQGAYVNYRGGNAVRHDLGIELDLGVEARFPLDYAMSFVAGAQGGVLFPGGAFADASDKAMNPLWLAVGRMGLMF